VHVREKMALRVWKKGILDKMRSQLVATLLQQIKKQVDVECGCGQVVGVVVARV